MLLSVLLPSSVVAFFASVTFRLEFPTASVGFFTTATFFNLLSFMPELVLLSRGGLVDLAPLKSQFSSVFD